MTSLFSCISNCISFLHAQLNETFVEHLGISWSFQFQNKSEILKYSSTSNMLRKNKCNPTCYKVYSNKSIDSQSPNGEGVRNIWLRGIRAHFSHACFSETFVRVLLQSKQNAQHKEWHIFLSEHTRWSNLFTLQWASAPDILQ